MKNYKEYIDYCQRLAEDVNDSRSDDIDVIDRIHEIADGCQHVIYYSKAWDLVNMIREYNYELFMHAVEEVQDNGFEHELAGDVNKLMTWIAFFLIRNGIHSAYQHIESEVVA
jgi:predicted glycosyltransferase